MAAALALGLLLTPASLRAQTATTWTRGGGNNNWSTAGNWSAGVPVAGYNAIFGANVGGDPNEFYTLTMDKITFATGGAAHTLQFGGSAGGWNVNAAGIFIEVETGNTNANQFNASRNNGQAIVLKSGTSTILHNGSGSLTVGSTIVSGGGALRSASGANSTLVVDGSGSITIGSISGGAFVIGDNGAGVLTLIKTNSGALALNGSNTFSGGLTVQGTGAVTLSHPNAAGTGTISLKSAQTSGVTTLGLTGGITVTNPIQMDSTTGREGISSTGTGNTSLTGGFTITGAGANALFIANNQTSGNLTVSGGISGASYGNVVSLRGSQAGNVGFLNGAVTLASTAQFDNNGATSWTLNTAGSTWGLTLVRGSGNFILGANDALATGARVVFDIATSTGGVDLNGYNQTVAGLETTATPTTGNGGIIINSSATTDSTLTLAGLTANRIFGGTIKDGATRKVALTMNSSGRTQTLTNANTYTGNTTISAGTLALSSGASITNSANIVVASNAVFDVSGLSSAFTLAQSLSTQTLSNSAPGAILNGTNNCSAGTVSLVYDGVNPCFTQTNGGMTLSASTTFKVNQTGAALAHGSYKIISKATAGNVGLVAGAMPAVTVSGGGITNTPGETASLKLTSSELYLVVNAAPVAKAITNGAPAGVTNVIRLIGGKPHLAPTDADGDALLVSSVQNPSALLSATVTTDGTNILYTPGLNASGADTVQYVVSDGYGGYSTNTMYVTVTGQSFNLVSGPTLTNNQFKVTFAGIPNYTYAVDDSTNSVTGPWAFYTNLTAGTNGLFQLVATNDPPVGSRFFRTRAPLP